MIIELRHDTAANWAAANTVLVKGEMGVEDDTGLFKLGDSITPWTGLAYANAGGGGGSYVLPVADATTLGGVKIGANVTVTGGAISVAPPVTSNAGLTNDAGYITAASLSGYALTSQLFSGSYIDLTNKPVLFSGAYADLSGKPILGTAAATDATAYATAAQGTLADAALRSVRPGTNVTIDNTDPLNPIINSTAAGGGGGTVTSVALTAPSWLTVAGSPVTSAGTLALSATAGQAAKQFLATPNATTGAVALRTIVASDIPTLNQSTTGNAGSATKLATARTIAGVSFDGTANIAIPFSGIATKPTTLAGYGITDAATSTQGAKADTAVQPGALATVATTGSYNDLGNKPTIPSLTGATAIAVVASLPGTPDANTLYFTTT